jgi:hypothetical protein
VLVKGCVYTRERLPNGGAVAEQAIAYNHVVVQSFRLESGRLHLDDGGARCSLDRHIRRERPGTVKILLVPNERGKSDL